MTSAGPSSMPSSSHSCASSARLSTRLAATAARARSGRTARRRASGLWAASGTRGSRAPPGPPRPSSRGTSCPWPDRPVRAPLDLALGAHTHLPLAAVFRAVRLIQGQGRLVALDALAVKSATKNHAPEPLFRFPRAQIGLGFGRHGFLVSFFRAQEPSFETAIFGREKPHDLKPHDLNSCKKSGGSVALPRPAGGGCLQTAVGGGVKKEPVAVQRWLSFTPLPTALCKHPPPAGRGRATDPPEFLHEFKSCGFKSCGK